MSVNRNRTGRDRAKTASAEFNALRSLRLTELAKQAGIRPDELRDYLRRVTG